MSTNYNLSSIRSSSLLICALLGSLTVDHQVESALTVNTTTTASALAILLPLDSSVTVSNIHFAGDEKCIGTFAGGLLAVPGLDPTFPDEGVVLGTGNVEDLPLQDSGSQSTNFGTPGDDDLDDLLGPGSPGTNDACVIEVDFECNNGKASEVFFNYVFGSDEYLEFAGSAFNDIFALFLNGEDLAIVPNTTDTPVSINTVNQFENTEYFVANEGLVTYPAIEMDGFTQKLTTAIGNATAGTNTLKIAIADTSDSIYDSWVLIEAGSVSCDRERGDWRARVKANAIARAKAYLRGSDD